MSPCRCSLGHDRVMNVAIFVSSADVLLSAFGSSGGTPDLLSSPDVLICSRTFNGGRSSERYLFRPVAPFVDVTVWTEYRFGIARRQYVRWW